MKSVVSSSGSSVDLHGLLNEENLSLSTASSKDTPASSAGTNPTTGDGPTPATEPSPTAPPRSIPLSLSQYSPYLADPSSDQAEECLNIFRSRMLPCFPFINIPPGLTAWQLRQDRPFLFKAIVTATSFSTQEKQARADELKQLILTSALLNVQSNIDLLLGLLTYIAWSTDAFLGRADLLSRLMMLAISIVYDLRLFKPSPPDAQLILTLTQGFYDDQNTNEETVHGFLEKQRAVLACFVLSSRYA
jgi:hypothetical protein